MAATMRVKVTQLTSPKNKNLPPDVLLKTWFDLLMKDIGDDTESKMIKKRAKDNLLAVFGSTEAAVAHFKDRGWVK